MISRVPAPLLTYTREGMAGRTELWQPEKWEKAFASRRDVFDDVAPRFQADGISRAFIHAYAKAHQDDAVALFLLTMAWGFAGVNYGPYRTEAMLAQPDAPGNLEHIVTEVRTKGAAAGWAALFGPRRVRGLNIAFGTKLLYFAGYHAPECADLRPLILDDRVRWSLYDLKRGTVPPPGSTLKTNKTHYLRYLNLAKEWAADPIWSQGPDVVEFGLFWLNGRYPMAVTIPAERSPTE